MKTQTQDNTLPASVLTPKQVKTYGPKPFTYCGERAFIRATVRHDDQCRNGHNTFAITGRIHRRADFVGDRGDLAGGCLHDEIAKAFPELAPFIKWHLVSTDEPLHYGANTVYHAGDRDHWGLRKGEFRQHTSRGPHQADGVPGVPHWELKAPDGTKHDVYAKEKPAPVVFEWVPSGITGEGKPRDFAAARSCAVWPEATDAELSQEPEALRAQLAARIPQLMTDFKAAVESLGFTY